MNNEFTIKLSNPNYMKELVSILVNSNYLVTVKKITHEWPHNHDYHYAYRWLQAHLRSVSPRIT